MDESNPVDPWSGFFDLESTNHAAANLADRKYAHPIFDNAALQAQSRLKDLDGEGGVFFCGSYWGWGLHEDGFTSGVGAAERVQAALQGQTSLLSEQERGADAMDEIDAIIAAAKQNQ